MDSPKFTSARPTRADSSGFKLGGSRSSPRIAPMGSAITTVEEAIAGMRKDLVLQTRTHGKRTVENTFLGSELVDWVLTNMAYRSRKEAQRFGSTLMERLAIQAAFDLTAASLSDDATEYVFLSSAPPPAAAAAASAGAITSTGSVIDREMTVDDFELVARLGSGGVGMVQLVKRKTTGRTYAMKRMFKSSLAERGLVENLLQEKSIMQNNHPYLVHLHYAFQSEDSVYLVMDFLRGGDLFFHLGRLGHLSESVTRFLVAELVLALDYLHVSGVIYRDLKPENVLLDADGHICLTDFGISKQVSKGDRTQSLVGTPAYLAPEVIKGEAYSYEIDWFGLGALTYECVYGFSPFSADNPQEVFVKILQNEVEYPRDVELSDDCIRFVQGLLEPDVARRLGCSPDRGDSDEIKQHPWFEGIDWDALLLRKLESPFKISIQNDTDCFDPDAESDDGLGLSDGSGGAAAPASPSAAPDHLRKQFQRFDSFKRASLAPGGAAAGRRGAGALGDPRKLNK